MSKQKYLPLVLFGGTGVKIIDKTKLLEKFNWYGLEQINSQIKFAQQLLKDKNNNKTKAKNKNNSTSIPNLK